MVLTALVLVGAAIGARRFGVLPPPPGGAALPPDSALPGLGQLDQRADTLIRAVGDYTERARLFDAQQMGCDGLRRSLVAVEQQWIAYNTLDKSRVPVLDTRRARLDRTLHTSVDSVQSHFRSSQCERPEGPLRTGRAGCGS